MYDWPYHCLLIATGAGAGAINALAGGGPILTLGILSVTGFDPRIANLTSTVALSPGQIVAGLMSRHQLTQSRLGPPLVLASLALAGGAIGAGLLLATPSTLFDLFVPWLVLIATALYAVSALPGIVTTIKATANQRVSIAIFAPMTIYGGYFGGGNSFLVLALLGLTGHRAKQSGEIKNVLIAFINLGAVIIFALSGAVNWEVAIFLGLGGVLGSIVGTHLLGRLSANAVRTIVIVGGLILAAWMFRN